MKFTYATIFLYMTNRGMLYGVIRKSSQISCNVSTILKMYVSYSSTTIVFAVLWLSLFHCLILRIVESNTRNNSGYNRSNLSVSAVFKPKNHVTQTLERHSSSNVDLAYLHLLKVFSQSISEARKECAIKQVSSLQREFSQRVVAKFFFSGFVFF